MKPILSVSDISEKFRWDDCNLMAGQTVLAKKSPVFMTVLPEFLEYFTFVNMPMKVCGITDTLRIKVRNTTYFGYLRHAYILLMRDDVVQLGVPYVIDISDLKYRMATRRVHRHWDMLEDIAVSYAKPIPFSLFSLEIKKMLKGVEFDPLAILDAMELSDDPTERLEYMRANKEALVHKLVAATFNYLKHKRIDSLIKVKPEIIQIKELPHDR